MFASNPKVVSAMSSSGSTAQDGGNSYKPLLNNGGGNSSNTAAHEEVELSVMSSDPHRLESNGNGSSSNNDDGDEDEFSRRYHRVDSADELNAERVPLGFDVREDHGWLVERDLDAFFRRVYTYYRDKGFGSIVATRAVDLVSTAFTIILSTFFLACFDWAKLNECRENESSCETFSAYVHSPFANASLFSSLVVVGSGVSTVYWAFCVASALQVVSQAYQTRSFFRERLKMSTRDLQTVEWSEIVSKLKALQDTGFRLQINNASLTALTVAIRIMRKENYMVALMCMNILPLGSPDFYHSFGLDRLLESTTTPTKQQQRQQHKKKRTGQRFHESELWWMGKTMEFNLFQGILNPAVDEHFQLNRRQVSPAAIRARLRWLAIINMLLAPVIFVFSAIVFFLQYAEEFHSRKNYLGPRFWTPHALWVLREFNELPHNFDRRVYGSLRYSERFMRLFPSPVPLVLARGVAFVLGGLVATLLVFALVDDTVLLHVRLWDRNLVWYAAILSTGLAGARALIPPPEEEYIYIPPHVQMRRVSALTHYLPEEWRTSANSYDVRDQFAGMVPFRIVLLLRELLSVLCNPYILGVVLPRHADDLSRFLIDFTVTKEGVGDVCTFSLLELEKHGDPKWVAIAKGEQAHRTNPFGEYEEEEEFNYHDDEDRYEDRYEDVEQGGGDGGRRFASASAAARRGGSRPRGKTPRGGVVLFDNKLERSWISFRLHYAAENSGLEDDVGEQLFQRVRDLQNRRMPPTQAQAQSQDQATALMMASSMFSAAGDDVRRRGGGGLASIAGGGVLEPPGAGTGEDVFWFMEQLRDESEEVKDETPSSTR